MAAPNPKIQRILDENKRLKEENDQLSRKVKSYKQSNANWWHIRFWAGKKIGEIFLGWRLSDSIKTLVRELGEGNVRNETIGNVLTHILWRFTRMGVIAILLAIIPSLILIVQTKLLSNQNELLDIQNERVKQQNLLIEAQRRSSYVFLMGNIMDAVNNELRETSNINRRLSPQLRGQIISLSNSLTPYQFMVGQNLNSRSESPERGMLLVFLLESEISHIDLNAIFLRGDFRFAQAESLNILDDTIDYLDLTNSSFDHINVNNSLIRGVKFLGCETSGFKMMNSILINSEFNFSDTLIIKIDTCGVDSVRFSGPYLHYIQSYNSEIRNSSFNFKILNSFEVVDGVIRKLSLTTDGLSIFEAIESRIDNLELNYEKQLVQLPFPALGRGDWNKKSIFLLHSSTVNNLIMFPNLFEMRLFNAFMLSEKELYPKNKIGSNAITDLDDSAISIEYIGVGFKYDTVINVLEKEFALIMMPPFNLYQVSKLKANLERILSAYKNEGVNQSLN